MTLQVLPDVRSVSLDDGFSYADIDSSGAVVGSVVRVPLAGRIVRGWVIESDDGPGDGLKLIRSVSGDIPVFSAETLPTLRWVSKHYVAPLASIIRAASAPNLPRKVAVKWEEVERHHAGRATRQHLMGSDPWPQIQEAIAATQDRGESVLVIVPTMAEIAEVERRLVGVPNLQIIDAEMSDHSITTVWSRTSATAGAVVLATARAALWPIRRLGLAVLIDEGRRSHKARQSPTLHTRTLLDARFKFEGVNLITTGVVPTTEVVGSGAELVLDEQRPWSTIEVVDRSLEPPGRGVFDARMKAGLYWAVREEKTVAVFTHRRGFAPAFRCLGCGDLRVCVVCGSRARTTEACERCAAVLKGCTTCGKDRFEPMGLGLGRLVEALQRTWGEDVGLPGQRKLITAITERDLAELGSVDLAVVVDADGLLLGTNYRAAEDGVRLMARVAGKATGRTLIQTLSPKLPGVQALLTGDVESFIRSQLSDRESLGFPPAGDIIVLEVRDGPEGVAARVAELNGDGVTAFGPQPSPNGDRWLIQGPDLTEAKEQLRGIADWMRRQGASLRIDVDPLDL